MGDQSVVSVWAGAGSQVTIKGWDRPNVQFDTDDEAVQVMRRTITFGTAQTPLSVSIPPMPITVRDPAAGGASRGTLPPEEFPYASDFRPGVHDSVRIVTGVESHLTVMVPASTALLDTRIRGGAGIINVDDYRGGTLFVTSAGGRTLLTDVMSAAFFQPLASMKVICALAWSLLDEPPEKSKLPAGGCSVGAKQYVTGPPLATTSG